MLSIIVIHNFAVLGLFALENITMAEMFGSRKSLYPDGYLQKRRAVWWQWGLVRCWRGSSVT